MIMVEGWVRLADAGEIERLRAVTVEMMRASQAEPGCLEYAYGVDLGDPAVLRLAERWTSEAALAAHLQSNHVAAFRNVIASAKIAGALIKAYAAEEMRVLMQR